MGQAAARHGDRIQATDTHSYTNGNTTLTGSFAFDGPLGDGLSASVRINGSAAAVVGSGADNQPAHVPPPPPPASPAFSFVSPPSNRGTVALGSATVRINGKAAARDGDKATTCTEPASVGNGQVVVQNAPGADVFVGG